MRLTLVSVFLGLAAFAGSADVPYDVFATLTLTSFTSPPATASQDATDARVQKLMDDFDKESLRDLDRGKPAQQIEAARRLGPKHAARISPVLIKYLGDRDPANRRAAADAVWSVAARDGAALASIQPALRIALNDQDPAAAMNAAGALTAMKLPDAETAGARRRVLQQGDGGPYVLFLAANDVWRREA